MRGTIFIMHYTSQELSVCLLKAQLRAKSTTTSFLKIMTEIWLKMEDGDVAIQVHVQVTIRKAQGIDSLT